MHGGPGPALTFHGHCERHTAQTLGFEHHTALLRCRHKSQDDARDTFKTLKNQHIGDGCACLYHEWASLEHSAGNVSKAISIVHKGIKADAQPASLLEKLAAEMQSGTYDWKMMMQNVTDTTTLRDQKMHQEPAKVRAPPSPQLK